MGKGYRDQTFRQRATSLPFGDWQSTKELLVEMGSAIDDLQVPPPCDTEDADDSAAQKSIPESQDLSG